VNSLVFVLLLGLLLRVPLLSESFWLDEATSGLLVRNYEFAGIWQQFLPNDFHPPLYYFLLEAWSRIFGTSEIALRNLSLVFAIATIYLTYLIAKKLFTKQIGVLAALFLAINPLHIYYSTEARMYSLAAFLVTLTVYFFIKLLIKKANNLTWVAFGLYLSLIFLTDYIAIFILPVFWIYAFLKQGKIKKQKRWFIKFFTSHILLFISLLVIWPLLKLQLQSGLGVKSEASAWWSILGQPSLKNMILIPIKFMLGRISFENSFIYGLVILLATASFAWPLSKVTKSFLKNKNIIIWLWLLTPIVFGIAVSLFIPVLSYFRFVFVLPALAILLSQGLYQLKENQFLPSLMLILILQFMFIFTYYRNPRFHREDWRGLADLLQREKASIVFVSNSQMEGLNYYGIDSLAPDEFESESEKIYLSRYVYNIFDPEDKLRRQVEFDYKKISEKDFNGVVVWEYRKNENSN